MANNTNIEISPLAPKKFPNINPVPGLRLCGQAVGLKSGVHGSELRDVTLASLAILIKSRSMRVLIRIQIS